MNEAAIRTRFDGAWNEVREFWDRLERGEASRDQDPQPRLAGQFFEYFLANHETELGRRALSTACTMWGNTASADAIDRALTRLDVRADYWEPVLHAVTNAYHRSGRTEAVIPLLQRYETILTRARSRSSLFLLLGRHHLRIGAAGVAHSYFERIVGLDARPSDVQEAEGGLYEIDTLATGNQAPRFEARTIDSELVRLVNLEGRVVCLDFCETTCGPCWREFSTLRTVNASFPVSDCQLVGISSDQDEAKLRSVIASEQLAWPQIREEVGWDGRRRNAEASRAGAFGFRAHRVRAAVDRFR